MEETAIFLTNFERFNFEECGFKVLNFLVGNRIIKG